MYVKRMLTSALCEVLCCGCSLSTPSTTVLPFDSCSKAAFPSCCSWCTSTMSWILSCLCANKAGCADGGSLQCQQASEWPCSYKNSPNPWTPNESSIAETNSTDGGGVSAKAADDLQRQAGRYRRGAYTSGNLESVLTMSSSASL